MSSMPAETLFTGDAAAVSRLLPAGGTQLNLSSPIFQAADHKSTPLIAAARCGHTDIVRTILLERAPNTTVDYVDAHGHTALMMAAQYHHADILRLLADRGGNVDLGAGAYTCSLLSST
jgi:ankyrin repeat protein